MYSKRELLNWLWKAGDGQDNPPSQSDLNDIEEAPAAATYEYRFDSWNQALRDAGYSEEAVLKRYPNSSNAQVKYTDEEVIRQVKTLAEELDRTPKADEFAAYAEPSMTFVRNRFDGYNGLLHRAGLEVNKKQDEDPQYSEEELLQHIRDVAEEIGKPPSVRDMKNSEDAPVYSTYHRHFESWVKARERALKDHPEYCEETETVADTK